MHSWPVEVLGLRTSDKINLTDFSQESSTLSNQHPHRTADILKKKRLKMRFSPWFRCVRPQVS